MPNIVGVRMTSNLVSIVAGAATTALWTISTSSGLPKMCVIKKVMWFNHTPGNITLQLGYDNLAVAWVSVMPDILCLAGMNGVITEAEMPLCGNGPEGFAIDTTALTGFAGVIAAQASASAAAPNDVEVCIEVMEY